MKLKRIAAAVTLVGAMSMAGLGLAAGAAHAQDAITPPIPGHPVVNGPVLPPWYQPSDGLPPGAPGPGQPGGGPAGGPAAGT